MSTLSRRQLLAGFLGGLVQAAGTVVLARSVLAAGQGQAQASDTPADPPASLQERADQLAAEQGNLPDDEGFEECSFLNGAFRNGGGFRNGGFVNGGFRNGGGFHNGGFANGGFHNGGFANGGFRKGGFANGGGFHNGGFRNGGFANGGFRKGGFLN